MLESKNTKVLLHLSLIPNIGPASVLKLIHVFYEKFRQTHTHPQITKPTFDLEELYEYEANNFVHKFGVSKRIAHLLSNGLKDKKSLEQELNLIKKYNIIILSFLDQNYPESLKQIYHPPLVIYCKGAPLGSNSKRIAIVGSRKADTYAKVCIEKIVPDLVQNNWAIVSGGAAGVDSMAHSQTLKNNGKTIVVFGSGLMCPYPAANKELFRSIVKNGGTLVSPFSLQTPPSKGNFPARNRIIAGLSEGCIVVQAAEKSGALITSQFALDQGKQVFALPGLIDHELSAGCHKLLQQGAKLITNSNDIFEEFGEEVKPTQKKESTHPIIKYLEKPMSIDELSNKTKLSLADLQNQLFTLQLEGKVKQNFAGLWEKSF